MVPSQFLRIFWAHKWVVLGLFLVIAIGGIVATLLLPKQYTAESALIVEMRIDPVLGALAPALAAPSYMATQVEVLRSERVASRAVKILGVERSSFCLAASSLGSQNTGTVKVSPWLAWYWFSSTNARVPRPFACSQVGVARPPDVTTRLPTLPAAATRESSVPRVRVS